MDKKTKVLALVAHDNMKRDLAEWVDWNSRKLSRHHLVCTGTTGKMVEKTLRDHKEEHEDDEPKPVRFQIRAYFSSRMLRIG